MGRLIFPRRPTIPLWLILATMSTRADGAHDRTSWIADHQPVLHSSLPSPLPSLDLWSFTVLADAQPRSAVIEDHKAQTGRFRTEARGRGLAKGGPDGPIRSNENKPRMIYSENTRRQQGRCPGPGFCRWRRGAIVVAVTFTKLLAWSHSTSFLLPTLHLLLLHEGTRPLGAQVSAADDRSF
nr:hypothetical protein CFP56_63725 [Quercus suber]